MADNAEGFCREPITNRAHVIPRMAVLDKLKDNNTGKVMELQWGLEEWKKPLFSGAHSFQEIMDNRTNFEPSSKGTHEACTGQFACKPDDEIFARIDVENPDYDDPTVRLLTIYRASLHGADTSRLGVFMMHNQNINVMRNNPPTVRVEWMKTARQAQENCRKAHSTIRKLGEVWRHQHSSGTQDLNLVKARQELFRSKLIFAACVFYGEHLTLIVEPVIGNLHRMTTLHLKENLAGVINHIEKLSQLSKQTQGDDSFSTEAITHLMTNGLGTVALSPQSYRELKQEDREAIQEIVASYSGVPTMKDISKVLVRQRPRPINLG